MQYYIMVDPDKPNKCKIGITKDYTNRIRSYRTAAPQCYFHSVYNIDASVKLHEKRILSILSEIVTVDREYVHCDPTIVQNIVEGYFCDINMAVKIII